MHLIIGWMDRQERSDYPVQKPSVAEVEAAVEEREMAMFCDGSSIAKEKLRQSQNCSEKYRPRSAKNTLLIVLRPVNRKQSRLLEQRRFEAGNFG